MHRREALRSCCMLFSSMTREMHLFLLEDWPFYFLIRVYVQRLYDVDLVFGVSKRHRASQLIWSD
jgi:hypothetical protein